MKSDGDERSEKLRNAAIRVEERIISVIRSTTFEEWIGWFDGIQSGQLSKNEFINLIFQKMNALSYDSLDYLGNKVALELWFENLTDAGFPNRIKWELAWRGLNN